MSTQPDLFGDILSPPPYSRSGASEEAAESMTETAATLRGRVLRLAIRRGLQGLTSKEAGELFGLSQNTCHPRFWELETENDCASAQKTRETVARQLFVVKGVRRDRHNVYFAFVAVSPEQVRAHYGVQP